jgi:hypothetical protein
MSATNPSAEKRRPCVEVLNAAIVGRAAELKIRFVPGEA